jgi:hypothetical protein
VLHLTVCQPSGMLAALQVRARRAVPNWARHLARLCRHAVPRWQPSPQVPAELLADCRVSASRFHLLSELPHGGRVTEVGTAAGIFAAQILSVCEPAELHLIDLDFSRLVPAVAADSRVILHAGRSHERLAALPDGFLDWAYIDADHSRAGVRRDAEAAAPKVRPGGFLVFNDFAHVDPLLGRYGVHCAVVEFAIEHRWPFRWFAYHPAGLYDVALQRPS